MNLSFNLVETTLEDGGSDNPIFTTIFDIMYDAQVFDNLLHDDISVENIYEGMKSLTIIQVGIDGEFSGVFSLEDLGEHCGKRVVEAHAYLMPSKRSHSKLLIEEMINFIFANTSFDSIITSVSDKYPLIQRFIKMSGFQDFMHREDIVSFDGIKYGMNYFVHERKDIPIVKID